MRCSGDLVDAARLTHCSACGAKWGRVLGSTWAAAFASATNCVGYCGKKRGKTTTLSSDEAMRHEVRILEAKLPITKRSALEIANFAPGREHDGMTRSDVPFHRSTEARIKVCLAARDQA